MASKYELRILSPKGDLLDIVPDFERLSYGKRVNNVGAFEHILPYRVYKLMVPDIQFEIYRGIDAGPLRLEFNTRWLGRTFTRGRIGDPFSASGFDLNDLLRRAIVNYAAGSAQAQKTGPGDNLIKDIARENLVNGTAGTGRGFLNFLVQNNTSEAPSLTKGFSRKVCLAVMQDLAGASSSAGTYLAFDVLMNGTYFELQTFTGARGKDNTFSKTGLLFSEENNTLENVSRVDDYQAEATKVFSGGTGTEADRIIGASPDDPRALVSPYGYIERWVDARNAKDQTGVDAEALAGLADSRPLHTFRANIKNTPASTYGKHFDYGSLITAQDDKTRLDCRIEAVSISFDQKAEKIEAKIEGVYS